jgi:integrase
VYPGVSLVDARKAHEAARKFVAEGGDPSQQKKDERAQRKHALATTFESVAREWHKAKLAKWTPDNAARILRRLEMHVFPIIGNVPIEAVTTRMVIDVVQRVDVAGKHETARRTLQFIAAVLKLAMQRGYVDRMVTAAIDSEDVISSHRVRNHPRVNADEMGDMLRTLARADLRPITRHGIELVALTAVRTSELRYARWSEFDFERAQWVIPAERMKRKDYGSHIVPLSKQAIAVLRSLQMHSGGGELLFPNQSKPSEPMSENTMLYAMNRMGYAGRHTIHGFRGLFSTMANETGEWDADVIELCLAHRATNAVRAAYNGAQRIADRTKLMQWWADRMDFACDGAKVLEMKRAG